MRPKLLRICVNTHARNTDSQAAPRDNNLNGVETKISPHDRCAADVLPITTSPQQAQRSRDRNLAALGEAAQAVGVAIVGRTVVVEDPRNEAVPEAVPFGPDMITLLTFICRARTRTGHFGEQKRLTSARAKYKMFLGRPLLCLRVYMRPVCGRQIGPRRQHE